MLTAIVLGYSYALFSFSLGKASGPAHNFTVAEFKEALSYKKKLQGYSFVKRTRDYGDSAPKKNFERNQSYNKNQPKLPNKPQNQHKNTPPP